MINNPQVTTHSGIALVMKRTLEGYGLDANALFAEAGVGSPDSLGSQDRVAAVAMQKLWRMAVEASGDEAFGIRYAQNMHPMALHGLGFSWMASDTLKDAFRRMVRYYRLITTAGEIVLDKKDGGFKVCHKIPAPKGVAAPASLDAGMALFIQLCRITKSDDFCASEVHLQRLRPVDTEPYDAFFSCPVHYDSDENYLVFNSEVMNAPLPGANPELARVNDEVVIRYLQAFDKQDIVGQIRASIIEYLPSGTITQDNIANQVHMSTRSMQRKLQEKGTSFKTLVETIRQELAETYLRDTSHSINEVTYLLGFTEPSNFSRSFKKWTGMSPADFQVRQQ